MRCGLKETWDLPNGRRINVDYTPIYEALKKAGFIKSDTEVCAHIDQPLFYDDDEPTPWARQCCSCEETDHVEHLHKDPASHHQKRNEHMMVCEYCYPKSALELLGYWEDWQPGCYNIDELHLITAEQLRLIAFMKDHWITYDAAYALCKGEL